MIARLLRFAIRQRFITLLMAGGLIFLGIWSFRHLKIEAYPDISDTGVVVITLFPGHAAEEVEQQVAIPIERALNNVPNVIARRSRIIFGLAVVELTFADGTDDYFARQLVLERLRDAELPEGVTPTLGPLSSGISEFYRYKLEGQGYDTMDLREIQDWVVVPRLLQVAGVADVVSFGGLVKQYQIEIDPYKLEKYKLSVAQIADAVNANNRNAGGSLLDNRQQALVVRGVGLIQSADDLGNIPVESSGIVPIFIRDIGRVTIGAAPQTGIFGVNETSGGAEGIVLMRRWENPSQVLSRIKEAIADLNQTRLPSGVQIVAIHDRTDLVNNTLHTVGRTLTEALVIVVTLLLFAFGSAKAAVLTALTIPLSLLFAFTCVYFQGIPANLLSIGALDFASSWTGPWSCDASLVLLNVPFSLVGGIVALYLRGINFSVSAAVGFVTLFGVAVMSGLLYISEITRRRAELESSLEQAVVEGARAQVRPAILLILVALLGMIPAATATGIGSDVQRPLATVIVGGLVSTLLLTLLVLPSLYYVAARREIKAAR
jgi:cobalt-zinc-cadmium resistance protein CzcA